MDQEPRRDARTMTTVEEAVASLIERDDTDGCIAYLRAHRDEIGEFCLQVRDRYDAKDRSTPFLMIAQVIEKLL